MEPQEAEPNKAPPEQKRRGVWSRVRRILAIVLLLVMVLSIAGMLFIQLPIFKRLVVNELVSTVEKSTNGTLSIGEVKGNLLEGFVMNDVTLRLKTGTKYDTVPLVHADHIIAKYSFIRWLRKSEFGITEMVLEHPVIRFVKFTGDTLWNFSLLTKPVPSALKAPPKPFTQIVDLASLRIQDGSLYMRDYNYPPRQLQTIVALEPSGNGRGQKKVVAAQVKEQEIDWSDVQVEGIDLDSRFYAHGSQAQSARINHLRFTEKQSGFFVQHLQCSVYRDSIQARMDDARITTGHSDLSFSIELAPPKIIESGLFTSIQHSSVKAEVHGPVISTYELKQFLPKPLGFLAGSPGIDLIATGEFGKLHIKKLALDLKDRGTIIAVGDIDNLHKTDSLWMSLDLKGKNLSNASLTDYVPGLHLPNLSRFGTIDIADLTYIGAPLDFHTTFAATSSDAGNASGDVILDLRNKQIRYHAGLRMTNFNIAALLPGTSYESSISAETQLAGHGTNWKTMASTIALKTDAPSSFGRYRITSLDLDGAIDGGTVTANHLDGVVEGGPEVHVHSAMIGLMNPTLPFHFDGIVNDFRLAQVLGPNSENPSRIDLEANLSGSAKDFEDVTGTAHLRLFDLAYAGHPLPEDTADLKILPLSEGQNSLLFRSSIANVTINRRFQLGTLTEDLPQHVTALMTAIEQRNFPEQGIHYPVLDLCKDSVDFDYRVHIKDLRPLADFLPRTFLLAQGTISGTVQGCPDGDLSLTVNGDSVSAILRNRLSLDSNLIAEDDTLTEDTTVASADSSEAGKARETMKRNVMALPKFGAGIPRIHLLPTNFHLAFHNLSNDPKKVLDHLNATLDFEGDSVVRLGSAILQRPTVTAAYKDRSLSFDASTFYNEALRVRVLGTSHFPNGDFDVTLDSVRLDYRNPNYTANTLRTYIWSNEGPAHILWTKSGRIQIDTLNIVHPLRNGPDPHNVGAQRIAIGGALEGDSVRAWARATPFELNRLALIVPGLKKPAALADFNGTVRGIAGTLSGTLERPQITARLFIDSMTYGPIGNQIHFDSNYADLSYRDQALRGTLDVHVAKVESNAPEAQAFAYANGSELRAVIDSIPMTMAIVRGPDFAADSSRAAVRPLSASVRAYHFPLDAFTPFIPPFKQLEGTADINFFVNGTRENILYSGQAMVQKGAFLLASTNMWYLFGGPVTFAKNALTFESDTVRNIASDDPAGVGVVNGSFNFSGFSITNFDLRLWSDRLMVLSDAAKESLPAYGRVIVNTGGDDFHFRNTFDDPWINGTINIMSAKVTMPSSNTNTQTVTSDGIIYRTLPNDSAEALLRMERQYLDSLRAANPGAALAFTEQSGSTRMALIDDTLFPNRMKDVYLNDAGTAREFDTTTAEITTPSEQPKNALAPTFADKLRMDLTINTQGPATVVIPFGAFSVIGAELDAELKSGGTVSIERGEGESEINAIGGFDLSQNSKFKFIQTFNITEGRIYFNHDFGNPNIDITAEYIGTHTKPGGNDLAKVELQVTGTKNQPTLSAANWEQFGAGGDYELRPESNQEEAQEDALYFLATQQFKNEVSQSQGTQVLASILPAVGSQEVTNLLNNVFGSTTSQFAIRSASLNLGPQNSAQITAAWREVTLKLGAQNYNSGTSSSQIGASFVADIPLSVFSNSWFSRKTLIELQYNPNQSSVSSGAPTQQPIFLSKFVFSPLQ